MDESLEEKIYRTLKTQRFYDWYVKESDQWVQHISDGTVSREEIIDSIIKLFKLNQGSGTDSG